MYAPLSFLLVLLGQFGHGLFHVAHFPAVFVHVHEKLVLALVACWHGFGRAHFRPLSAHAALELLQGIGHLVRAHVVVRWHAEM